MAFVNLSYAPRVSPYLPSRAGSSVDITSTVVAEAPASENVTLAVTTTSKRPAGLRGHAPSAGTVGGGTW